MRLIDADEFLKTIYSHQYMLADRCNGVDCGMFTVGIKQAVDEQPVVDAAPVVHGKNITPMNPVDEFVCSECGFTMRDISGYDSKEDVFYEYELQYCPACGAKMDLEE